MASQEGGDNEKKLCQSTGSFRNVGWEKGPSVYLRRKGVRRRRQDTYENLRPPLRKKLQEEFRTAGKWEAQSHSHQGRRKTSVKREA